MDGSSGQSGLSVSWWESERDPPLPCVYPRQGEEGLGVLQYRSPGPGAGQGLPTSLVLNRGPAPMINLSQDLVLLRTKRNKKHARH